MTRKLHLTGAALLMVALSGCVSQEKYNALKLDRDGLAEQLGKAQNDASTARAEADSYKGQLASILASGGNMQGLVTNLQQQNANLQATLDDLNRRYADAMAHAGQGSPLPPALTNDLTSLAAANPDVMEFDSARGIVKFKSDVTFAKGDANLQARAKEVIDRFAQIVNSPSANGFELLVAGHTDNTPVSNPATKAAGHKDNWYLSAHRAIAVSEEMITRGTNAQRLGVVGYADQRPIASNSSAAGQAQNRRVEVLILPTTVRSSSNIASTPAPAPTRTSSRQPSMNKDGGGSSARTGTGSIYDK
jgi:chemotaxis protein MotB